MNMEEISLQKGTTHQDRSSSRGHRGESSVVSAVLVVALVAGSGLMIAWLLHQYVLDLLEEGLAANRLLKGQDREELEAGFSAFRDLGPFTGIFSALFSVVQWSIGAGMLTAIAVLLGGRGEFERVFVRTGPAHIPILLGNILVIALLLTIPLPRDVTLPANERNSLGFLVSFQEASQSLGDDAIFVALRLIVVGGYVWMYLLWVEVVRRVETLDLVGSCVAVGVTAALLHGIPWFLQSVVFPCHACR